MLLEIPHELKLDPVARERGVDPALFSKENPVQKDLTAVIKSLSEFRLPKLIEENLEKEQALKNEQILKKARGPEEDLGQGYDRDSSLSR